MQLDIFGAQPEPPRKKTAAVGRKRRDDGMARVSERAGNWRDLHDAGLRMFLHEMKRKPFQTEDFRDWFARQGNPPAHSPNVWGALWNVAARRGWIVKTGRRIPMRSEKAHARETAEWRSNL